MGRLPKPPSMPPPPTDLERAAGAIDILNNIDCEYEIRIRQTVFSRKKTDKNTLEIMNRKFKKLDPNTSKEELIRLVNEGRIYMYEEDYERMHAEMQHSKNRK